MKKCSNLELSPDDRISPLPVDILVHILSFLKLKESAQTSVLSRRWMTLWTYVSSLSFEDINGLIRICRDRDKKHVEKERCKFITWVNENAVLHSHTEGDSSLNVFRVHFDLAESSKTEIDKWLRYAFARRVKRLELNFSRGSLRIRSINSYPFPKLLFDCHFSKSTNRRFSGYNWMHHNDFNSLKELTLNSVNVTEEVFQLFLLKFPYLEHLAVLGSVQLQNVEVSGSSLVLKKVINAPLLTEVHIYSCYPTFPLYVLAQLSSYLSQLEVRLLNTDMAEEIAELNGISELSNLKELVINVEVWDDGSQELLPS